MLVLYLCSGIVLRACHPRDAQLYHNQGLIQPGTHILPLSWLRAPFLSSSKRGGEQSFSRGTITYNQVVVLKCPQIWHQNKTTKHVIQFCRFYYDGSSYVKALTGEARVMVVIFHLTLELKFSGIQIFNKYFNKNDSHWDQNA